MTKGFRITAFIACLIGTATLANAQLGPPPSLPDFSAKSITRLSYSPFEIEQAQAEAAKRREEVVARQQTIALKQGTGNVECISGDCFGGTGVFVNADGSQYNGEHSGGLPNGYGTYIWANGEKYTGAFKAGLKHGDVHILS